MVSEPSILCFSGFVRLQGTLGLLSQWCSLSKVEFDIFLLFGESFKSKTLSLLTPPILFNHSKSPELSNLPTKTSFVLI